MKKIILLLFSLFAIASTGLAQNILHAILVAATYDTSIGPAVYRSHQDFAVFLNTIAKEIDYEFDEITLSGNDCKNKMVMDTIDAFKCDTSDIVVFAYFGHGVRSVDDKSEFPQMCLHGEREANYIPLEYVKNRLAQHGARLTWVIGDCCNSYGEFVHSKEDKLVVQPMTVSRGSAANLYPQLFKKFTGVVTMCASKKGTYGWCNNGTGMFFTNALIDNVNHLSLNDVIPNQPWQSVMKNIQMNFNNYPIHSEKYPGKTFYMIPQYLIEPRQKPSDNKPKDDPWKNNDGKKIAAVLTSLANDKISWIERTRQVEGIMKDNFAPEAKYRKITSSGTPYDGGSVRKYLEEIARVDNIANIVVLNVKRNNSGKITYVDVIEVKYVEQ